VGVCAGTRRKKEAVIENGRGTTAALQHYPSITTGCPVGEVRKACVEKTVRHEIAHHFGISDSELLEKGLY
ncbi:MAG: metallopeptidase family protein, partial [Elusimicrobiales bacterium]